MNAAQIFPKPGEIKITEGWLRKKSEMSITVQPDLYGVCSTVMKLYPELTFLMSEKDGADIKLVERPNGDPESYSLIIDREEITIFFSTPRGAFYGLGSLCQLILTTQGNALPCVTINDRPGLKTRGVLLDISRGKIPTIDTLKYIADILCRVKINHLELYIEGTSFAYPQHKDMWSCKTPLTPKEFSEFECYCADRFIDLVPCQNSLGHMGNWLSDEKFIHLAECEDGFSVMGFNFPPTTLDVVAEESFHFVSGLWDSLLKCSSSGYCNICLDEPFELSMGKNAKKRERKYELYVNFAQRLNQHLAAKQRRTLMWDDVIIKDLKAAKALDSEIVFLDWGYEAEHPFEQRAELLKESGHEFCLCPGTNSWLSFTGMSDNMIECIKHAADAAYKFGAMGMIVTDWGDLGHLQYLPASFPGILLCAAYSWNPIGASEEELASALNAFVFMDAANVMGQLSLDAGRYYRYEEFRLPCRTLASTVLSISSMRTDEYLKKVDTMAKSIVFFSPENVCDEYLRSYQNREAFHIDDLLEFINGLQLRLEKSDIHCANAELIYREMRNSLSMVDFLTKVRAKILSDAYSLNESVASVDRIMREHRLLWNGRNRPQGCDESLQPFYNLREMMKK